MKTVAEKRTEAYKILAKNRYASRPEHITPQQWGNIRRRMYDRYMDEWMATTPGLYTDSEIWSQTFAHILK